MTITMRRSAALAAVVGLGALMSLGPSPDARAGSRALGLVLVDVTKGAEEPARKSCADDVRRAFGRDEWLVYASVSPQKLDKRLAKPVGEGWRTADKKAFDKLYEWEPSRWYAGAKRTRSDEGSGVDTVVFIDCDPDARRLELVGYNVGGGARVEVTLRGAEAKHLAALGAQRVMAVAWQGFNP